MIDFERRRISLTLFLAQLISQRRAAISREIM